MINNLFHTNLYKKQFRSAVKRFAALQWLDEFLDLYDSIRTKDLSVISVTQNCYCKAVTVGMIFLGV